MSGSFLGLVIESLVAVLLVLTIFYCMVLNRRIKRLRADETSMRKTIAELVSVTENAQRSISELRMTVQDCDRTLGERLQKAERFGDQFDRQLERGEDVLARIVQIAGAADDTAHQRQAATNAGNGVRRASDTIAAAQAIADRMRPRGDRAL